MKTSTQVRSRKRTTASSPLLNDGGGAEQAKPAEQHDPFAAARKKLYNGVRRLTGTSKFRLRPDAEHPEVQVICKAPSWNSICITMTELQEDEKRIVIIRGIPQDMPSLWSKGGEALSAHALMTVTVVLRTDGTLDKHANNWHFDLNLPEKMGDLAQQLFYGLMTFR
jgi:hypothetical protein